MKDTRYQFQPWYVKLWRRRWYLWYYLMGVYRTVEWITLGCQRNKWVDERQDTAGNLYIYSIEYDSRWNTLKFLWDAIPSYAQYKMEWYYTLDEIISLANGDIDALP